MSLFCRYYAQQYPAVDDVVMVTVRSIAEMGAYVQLLEYNNIEGMIMLSELSRRRIRSMNKLIRVGKTEPVVVIRVDEDKGYIDLSKRRVSKEDVDRCTEKFAKAKAVSSILRHVGQLLNYSEASQVEDLYKKTAWYFEDKYKRPAYDIFKQSVENNSMLDVCELDAETRAVLLSQIQIKLQSLAVKVRADIEVYCYEYEGIDAVKSALKAGIEVSTEDIPINISLISPPLYVMTTNTTERQAGLDALKEAISKVEEKIKNHGGILSIKMEPKIVTDVEDADLARQMEAAEEQQREVGGDDEDDYFEDGDLAEGILNAKDAADDVDLEQDVKAAANVKKVAKLKIKDDSDSSDGEA